MLRLLRVFVALSLPLGMALSLAGCNSAGFAQPAASGWSGGPSGNPLQGGGG